MLLVALACSDNPASESEATPELAPIEVPTLSIASPEHGEFVGDNDEIRVQGKVAPGSAHLTTLQVNGKTLDIAATGGNFDGNVPLLPGVNILGTRLEASDGGRAVDGRAVMAGAVWEPGERLSETVKLQIGPKGLDDDKADLDDMASIAETVLADPDTVDLFVGYAMPTDYYTITLTDASLGNSSVDITPSSGELTVVVTVNDLWTAFDIAGVSWYDWLSTTGEAGADTATISVTLELSADKGEVTATPTAVDVSLSGFWVTVDWFPDSLEGDLADWTQATLEETVADAVSERVQTLVGEYLSAFSTNVEFGDFLVNVALASLRVAEDGVRLTLDAWVDSPVNIDLPKKAGSLRTDNDGPAFPLTTTEPFAAAADDDLLHQLLFGFWASGATSGYEFDGLTLTALAGEIPPPLGPVKTASIEVNLPVTTGKPTYPDQDLDIAIGELRMRIVREDGEKIDASINLRTGAVLSFSDDSSSGESEVGFTLDARPSYMTLEVGMEAWPKGLDPGDMAALMRLTTPPLLDTLGGALPNVPIPDIPLSSFSDSLQGSSIGLTDPAVHMDDGWIVIEGKLAER